MITVLVGSFEWWCLFIMGGALGVLLWLLVRDQF